MHGPELEYQRIKVADVGIKVGFGWGDLGIREHFPEESKTSDVTLDVGLGYSIDGSQIKPKYHRDKMELIVGDGDGAGVCTFEIIRHIGFLVGDLSEKYKFCHGAGVNINGKGVMLVGKSGNGKSTLASILEGDILDDDMMLATPSEMSRVGKYGAKIDGNEIDWIKDKNQKSKIDYVFLLNNDYDPDHAVEVDPSKVQPETTFDDKLHPALLENYRRRMPIEFDAPVIEIGTKRNPEETKKMIEDIVRK